MRRILNPGRRTWIERLRRLQRFVGGDERDRSTDVRTPSPHRHGLAGLRLLPSIAIDEATSLLDQAASGLQAPGSPRDSGQEPRSLTSVIVVTHNNLLLTRLCLESLRLNTDSGAYEVVVVDNGSADGTTEFLSSLSGENVRVVFNGTNEGFPRANNQGIQASRGRYLVLLNNDTIVPPGWLPALLAHLEDPEVGLVGPLTNATGNGARIDVPYGTWADMETFAAEQGLAHARSEADIPILAMFCVAMRRTTYDHIGPLDEQFGIGMFEDDDYAHRLRLAGYRVVCAGDAFVHHVGEATFKALIDRGDYGALFERNRRAFERKWQTRWVRHTRRPLVMKPRREGFTHANHETA